MMYFVEKIKLKELKPNVVFPVHQLVAHCYTLEEAIKLVKDKATEYMVKKTLAFTDKTDPSKDPRIMDVVEKPKQTVRFTMRSNHANKHIIDIYREEESFKTGWVSNSMKHKEEKIAYFVYSTYKQNIFFGNTESEAVIPIAPPNPKKKTCVHWKGD